jgi:hypothetical protein
MPVTVILGSSQWVITSIGKRGITQTDS